MENKLLKKPLASINEEGQPDKETGDDLDDESDDEVFDNNLAMCDQQRAKIKSVFVLLDKDGNGYICKKEFRHFIKKMKLFEMTSQEVDMVFDSADTSNSGKLTLENFIDYFMQFVLDDTDETSETKNFEHSSILD